MEIKFLSYNGMKWLTFPKYMQILYPFQAQIALKISWSEKKKNMNLYFIAHPFFCTLGVKVSLFCKHTAQNMVDIQREIMFTSAENPVDLLLTMPKAIKCPQLTF